MFIEIVNFYSKINFILWLTWNLIRFLIIPISKNGMLKINICKLPSRMFRASRWLQFNQTTNTTPNRFPRKPELNEVINAILIPMRGLENHKRNWFLLVFFFISEWYWLCVVWIFDCFWCVFDAPPQSDTQLVTIIIVLLLHESNENFDFGTKTRTKGGRKNHAEMKCDVAWFLRIPN